MVDIITKLITSAGIGLFFGILAYLWVRPKTPEGIALLFLIFILFFMTIGLIYNKFNRKTPPIDTHLDN